MSNCTKTYFTKIKICSFQFIYSVIKHSLLLKVWGFLGQRDIRRYRLVYREAEAAKLKAQQEAKADAAKAKADATAKANAEAAKRKADADAKAKANAEAAKRKADADAKAKVNP